MNSYEEKFNFGVGQWQNKVWSDHTFAGWYFLFLYVHKYGEKAVRRKSSSEQNALSLIHYLLDNPTDTTSFLNLFSKYLFKNIRPIMNITMSFWLAEKWKIQLLSTVPTPNTVLSKQTKGIRVVTATIQWDKINLNIFHKDNALDFFIHDLEHAYKFYSDDQCFKGQVGFFNYFKQVLLNFNLLENGPIKEKIEYLMSDMNTHCIHSLKYLIATLFEKYNLTEIEDILLRPQLNNPFLTIKDDLNRYLLNPKNTDFEILLEKKFIEIAKEQDRETSLSAAQI